MRFLLLFFVALPALAACPKNKKEWQKVGPKLLVEKASRQHARVEIEDFSARLGKKGTTGSAFLYGGKTKELVMVQAEDKDTALFLSGTLKCDEISHEPVLLSLAFVKGKDSGLIKVVSQ
jgi:hypothetical protein